MIFKCFTKWSSTGLEKKTNYLSTQLALVHGIYLMKLSFCKCHFHCLLSFVYASFVSLSVYEVKTKYILCCTFLVLTIIYIYTIVDWCSRYCSKPRSQISECILVYHPRFSSLKYCARKRSKLITLFQEKSSAFFFLQAWLIE